MSETAIIIGGGPAGLTAGYELLEQSQNITPEILEASDMIGGISRTINHNGNRMDLGGHRFFSKNEWVMNWWQNIMPTQGAPSKDDILLNNNNKELSAQGPNPEIEDRVMLVRGRVSRIFYLRKFFDYPISLRLQTFTNMGLFRTIYAGMGYVWSNIFKKREDSLENFYINRFGKPLYRMFFEDYTEKVWGIHPSCLGADWGSQRVKGLSVWAILKDMLAKPFRSGDINQKEVETSLIEQFIYPKYGPGQLWETVASDVQTKGGVVSMNSEVKQINVENNKVVSVVIDRNGKSITKGCDYLLSSMPIKDLVAALNGIELSDDVKRIASELPYRDFITVGLLLKDLSIKNKTKIKTYKNRVPDNWIYIQERDVKIGRLQVFNNWSPYMVKDYANNIFIGLEYFCSEGDEMWNMSKEDFINMAIDELVKIDIIERDNVIDSVQEKVYKAYPAYHGTYYEMDKVRAMLDTIENLYCIGRNGQHRYNNMDHSMLSAYEAVKNIVNGQLSKENIWSVNTEEEYHETKK